MICGVSGLAPRVGESFPLNARLDAADCKALGKKYGRPLEPGLYQVGLEVYELMRGRRAAALGKDLDQLTKNDLL